jgi:predicted Zn finger-like uncharacterized protein
MNVTCPGCATIYRVDPAKVPAAGVRARCQVCSAVFAVRRIAEAEAAVRAPMVEPATLVRPVAARPVPIPPPSPEPVPVPQAAAPAPPPRSPEPPTEPSIRIPTFDEIAPAPPAPRATEPRLAIPVAPVAPAAPAAPVRPALRPPTVPVQPFPPAGTPPLRPTSPAGTSPVASPPRAANPFLNQDPNQKARRLARALISDLAVYFPDRRKKALAGGTLKAEFEEEIRKSWEEYTEQVGKPMAESTTHFTDALNEILASGQKVF